MLSKDYWKAALERALSAGAAAIAALGLGSITGALKDVEAAKALGVSFAAAFLFSIVKGLIANATNEGTGPGLGKSEITQPAAGLPTEDRPASPPEGDAGSDAGDPPQQEVLFK